MGEKMRGVRRGHIRLQSTTDTFEEDGIGRKVGMRVFDCSAILRKLLPC